jgi:hypothetical protein
MLSSKYLFAASTLAEPVLLWVWVSVYACGTVWRPRPATCISTGVIRLALRVFHLQLPTLPQDRIDRPDTGNMVLNTASVGVGPVSLEMGIQALSLLNRNRRIAWKMHWARGYKHTVSKQLGPEEAKTITTPPGPNAATVLRPQWAP